MKRTVAAVAAVLMLALAGCSANDGTGVTAAGAEGSERAPGNPNGPAPESPPGPEYQGNLPDPRYPVQQESGPLGLDWSPPPNFAKFVEWSHAAVIGRVTTIGPKRVNVRDGTEGGVLAMEFRDATVQVDEVLYDSANLPTKAGQSLTVRLLGDGTNTGKDVHGAEPVEKSNAISGPVAVGDRVLWVLGMAQFPFMDGSTEATPKLVADYYGAWRIGADLLAQSVVPARSVPLAALAAKLKAERATPSDGRTGQRGRVNPLE